MDLYFYSQVNPPHSFTQPEAQKIPVPVGEWIHLEAYYEASDPNTPNGTLSFWQNGVQLFHIENVITTLGEGNVVWGIGNYTDHIDGGPTPGSATLYYDDCVVSALPMHPHLTVCSGPCDDGDDCTTEDGYNDDCDCVGTYVDEDEDGVCAADDPDDSDPCVPVACGCSDLAYDDFEQGWGNWNDGGSDCKRDDYGDRALDLYSVRIRDNSGKKSSTYTDVMDLTDYHTVNIQFSYYPRGMENGEDFFLELSTDGGITYSLIREWNAGQEFFNDSWYSESVTVEGPFGDNCRWRFRCDASSNSDRIYLDNITLEGCVEEVLEYPLVGQYRLRNVWTNTYLAQTNDYEGAPIAVIELNTGWSSQIWNIEQGAEGAYRLRGKWTDWYLNVEAVDNNSPANVYPLNSDWWSQMWYLEPLGNGVYRLKNRWSESYLNAQPNDYVSIHDLDEGWQSQQWVLEPLDSPESINPLANPNANEATVAAYQYLDSYQQQPDQCLLLGQELGWSLDQYEELIQSLEDQSGQQLGVMGGQMRSAPDEIDYPAFVDLCVDWQAGNGFVELSMIPDNPWTGGSVWDVSETEIWKLTTPGEEGYDAWRAELDFFADVLKTLENAGVTVLWRPLHEMNGDWFWYGYQGDNNPQPYIDLYRDLFDYYTYTWNLNNLIWVYAPNVSYTGIPAVDHYYPGDDVVDLTGLDVYVTDLNFPVDQYQTMIGFNKPFAFTEFGPTAAEMDGSHDYLSYTQKIIDQFGEVRYAIAWHDWPGHSASWISNQNHQAALSHPCVVGRNEVMTSVSSTSEFRLKDAGELLQQSVSVFPNPADGVAVVSLSSRQGSLSANAIRMFDVANQEIALRWERQSATDYLISWGSIPVGMYFVQVETEDGVFVAKVLVVEGG